MQTGELLFHLLSALGAALVGAGVALRLGQPVIVGYLLAGAAIGPFTPGFIGDADAISEIAEIGVILLMFVVGAQLSLRKLAGTGRVVVLGGLVQVLAIIGIGYFVGRALGWSGIEAYAFGAVLSNSSSTVLSKVLSDRGEMDSRHASLGVAWSSVQDISTVALVAVITATSPGAASPWELLGRAALFFLVLVPMSFWVIPRLLHRATALRSREFFSVLVITLALAMAAGASVLGVSLALGAFLAGIVVGEADLEHLVLGDAIPLRDAFSGIFFVSIGMLLNPGFVIDSLPRVALGVVLIVVLKGALSALIARWLGCTTALAVSVGGALAQSGEFSFLLARIGLQQGALSADVFNLLLSSAIVSILLAPAVNAGAQRLAARLRHVAPGGTEGGTEEAPPVLGDHAIVCGYGRVGTLVCSLLERRGKVFVVVEEDPRLVETLRARGVIAFFGDAGQPHVLDRAHLRTARLLVLCVPDRIAVRRAAAHAREVGAAATVLARTHGYEERRFLESNGVDEAVVAELELALELGRRALERFDVPLEEIERTLENARRMMS
jgi:CPA2 family monovalent cation:H+ antiporter-2